MTTTIKITSHNYPARVLTLDGGVITSDRLLHPEDGEQSFYCTTTREIRVVDIDENLAPNPSVGEQRVRTSFNPSANSIVDQIKTQSAMLINLVEQVKHKDPRLAAIAQTAYEEAAMWAVKAATA